jgi:hypothetical protein
VPVDGGHFWQLIAPEDTTIKTLELEQSFAHSTPSALDWFLLTGNQAQAPLLHIVDDGKKVLPPPAKVVYPVSSTSVAGFLICLVPFGCSGGEFVVTLEDLVAVLEDTSPPKAFPPVVAGAPAQGVVRVGFGAEDAGAGIASVALVVDGNKLPPVAQPNGGECRQPYQFLVPCSLDISSSLTLDTSDLSDGEHNVQVAVTDAAGQRGISDPTSFTVHNAPTNFEPPALEGLAKVGEQLAASSGVWDGSPTAFSYQWLRCPATGGTSGCAPISGATKPLYVPVAADAGGREAVAVTATNPSGSQTAFSAPSSLIEGQAGGGPDTTPPLLSNVSLSHRRLPIEKTPTSKGMALLHFSCNEGGQLTITIERVRRGHPAKNVATLAAKIKAGPSAVPLSATIGGHRLTPGTYQVTISVRDAAKNVSKPARRPFTVVGG